MEYKDIIFRIAQFRDKRNMSAFELSQIIGHSGSYMYRVESGEIKLSVETLLDILKVLNVSVIEFFLGNGENFDLELLEAINCLSKENRNVVIDLIKKLK